MGIAFQKFLVVIKRRKRLKNSRKRRQEDEFCQRRRDTQRERTQDIASGNLGNFLFENTATSRRGIQRKNAG